MRRFIALFAAVLMAVGMMAGPAFADHGHKLTTPGTCVDGLGAGQPHAPGDSWKPGQGKYFHSGLHMGATGEDNKTLGKGNSRVTVIGGYC